MTPLAQLRDKTQLALADAATWPDATVEDWLIDAIREFPILRPRQSAQKSSAGVHAYDLPADFSEVISVEYPLDQEPKAYLLRFSHYRQEFWAHEGYFDIERDFHAGKDFELWISNNLASDEDIYVNYMACHDTELVGTSTITVPDSLPEHPGAVRRVARLPGAAGGPDQVAHRIQPDCSASSAGRCVLCNRQTD